MNYAVKKENNDASGRNEKWWRNISVYANLKTEWKCNAGRISGITHYFEENGKNQQGMLLAGYAKNVLTSEKTLCT